MKDLISIIIPIYKVEKYLDRCLESVANQTYQNLEIILVDDGSPDECPQMCDEWAEKDQRIKVIHKKNGGAGSARNAGIDASTGSYIMFVDADDWVDLSICEILHDLLIKNPGSDMALSGIKMVSEFTGIDKTSNADLIEGSKIDTDGLLEEFFRIHGENSNYGVCSKLLSKNLFQTFRFKIGTISEDVLAVYYFYTHCTSAIETDKPLYSYFYNGGGVTRARVTEKDFEYIRSFEVIKKDIKEKHKEFLDYAEMNVIRANYTILSKMKLYGYDKQDVELVNQYKKMQKIVRRNFWKLMKWKMPFSRKVLLIYDCI